MPVPFSTYRVQLHAGFGFDDAAGVAGYLAELGVSHLYTSPVLQAAPGSTHGYDVVDHRRANDELGGESGRLRLAAALRAQRLGTVVDIVPNHVSVAVPKANPWWWDVLTHGRDSAYASYFDVDWSRPRILLPVLGDSPDELDALSVVDGELAYYDHRFPIAPGTEGGAAREVHDRQHYELASWRRAAAELGYRRFFDINDLAAVRVEDPAVFADAHRETLRWVAEGDVEGLRIDHPDGLADPGGYLARLAAAAPGAWVVVEKILEPGEPLPTGWDCAGTTGYDALREVCGLFVDPAGEEPLTRAYAELTGEPTDFGELAHTLKLRAATTNLRAETLRLAALAPDVERADEALAEVMACLPVYRSYLPDEGADVLRGAVRAAATRRPDLAESLSTLEPRLLDPATELAVRLQQTSGMVMAKGVEDTAFYCYNRFVALNEVGGDPSHFGVSPAEFHSAAAARQAQWPQAMTALSTHDTKRSEDVRARLAVLSELPDVLVDGVARWSARVTPPDPNLGHLAWQTLLGAWPLTAERTVAYLEKASREAKQHTSWTDRDEDYDARLRDFVAAVFADADLLADLEATATRLAPYGWSNSLGQKLLQLTSPGVPDVYQGTELWDLSLVDPDNRRPVDYDTRRGLLAEVDGGADVRVDESGAAKLLVVARALRLRRERPDAFAASYERLEATGPAAAHAVAFARGGEVVAVATRLPVGLEHNGGWGDTTLPLPEGSWTDVLTGSPWPAGPVRLADLLSHLPVALLARS